MFWGGLGCFYGPIETNFGTFFYINTPPLPYPIQASPFLVHAHEYALSLLSLPQDLSQPINVLGSCKRPGIPQDSWVMYYV